jgi:FkbM family methyltransferase|tara:strand:- start:1555 stop:2589 length:1035 start_codon:yes stop_codon:yes gene_type:complete
VFGKEIIGLTEKVLPFVPIKYLRILGDCISDVVVADSQTDQSVELSIGDVCFSLWLSAGLSAAGRNTYLRMNRTGDVYELAMVTCLQSILDQESEPVFMDLGAYAGYYSCYAAAYKTDRWSVYAVESNSEHCKNICRSIDGNGYKNVTVLNTVLSDQEELLTVYKESVANEDHLKGLTNLERNEIARRQQILRDGVRQQSETIDSLCERETIYPTVLKVDVRGSEGKVLAGASHILTNSLNYILLEVHPEEMLMQYSPGHTRRSIIQTLNDAGFNCYLIAGFRTTKRSPEYKHLLATGELSFHLIAMDNFETVFFDRNGTDVFVLAVKDTIDISVLPCFAEVAK